jgi:hypothetical protein
MDRTDTHPGLGPTRSRKLIEFFGSIEGVLNASLTSLEAAGLPVAAAQSLGTGKSLEFARDEIAKADAAGVQLVPRTTRFIRRGCDKSTILRSCSTSVASWTLWRKTGSGWRSV